MRTLIVPDVHEDYDRLLKIERDFMEQADRVVMLGDFFDTFFEKQVGLIATWLLGKLYDPKYNILWGNHDCHYAFNNPLFICSGYDKNTKAMLRENFREEDWRQFQLWTQVGMYVVSHAGWHPTTTYLFKDDTIREAIDLAFKGKFHPLWQPGRSVGGPAPIGGPTWLRWWELEKLDFPQIVGHTHVKEPKWDEWGNLNLDTSLKWVAWVDEDTDLVTLEQT